MQPPATSLKFGGQLAVDAGIVGSAVAVQPTSLHGVGLASGGANGHVVNVTGPPANVVRHGT